MSHLPHLGHHRDLVKKTFHHPPISVVFEAPPLVLIGAFPPKCNSHFEESKFFFYAHSFYFSDRPVRFGLWVCREAGKPLPYGHYAQRPLQILK